MDRNGVFATWMAQSPLCRVLSTPLLDEGRNIVVPFGIIIVAILPLNYCERKFSSHNIVQILNSLHRKGDLNIVKIIRRFHFKECYTNYLKKKRSLTTEKPKRK